MAPTIEDLTDRAVPVNPLTDDYPTGAWGERGARLPRLHRGAAPRDRRRDAGRSRQPASRATRCSQALIKAIWTEDAQLSTRINRAVAHYTGQAELAEGIQEGLEARKAGDEATATFKLGRAVQLAAASGNDGR